MYMSLDMTGLHLKILSFLRDKPHALIGLDDDPQWDHVKITCSIHTFKMSTVMK